ncbi:MAG: exopolyphosphatase, partial [Actinomycetota bacterium]|nr:exopolyphosphatase [Actinomycetota bacterium]
GGPSEAHSYGVYWPALVDASEVHEVVVMPDGSRLRVAAPPGSTQVQPRHEAGIEPPESQPERGPAAGEALGTHFAARSGDKGGNANVGIWARDDAGYAWLQRHLTAEVVRQLLPEATGLEVQRYELPNIHALNFVIVGLLGEGVASSTAFDTQAKGLGEYLRSRPWPG